MKDQTINIHFKSEPVLLDKVLQDLQTLLTERLDWLDLAFGRAYKLTDSRSDGSKLIYPAAYNGHGEYVSLIPNDMYGNFSWFDIYDPQKITTIAPASQQYTFDGAIVFWYDLSKIYADDSVLYSEEIKYQIIRLLTEPGTIRSIGRLTINAVYENLENVYKGYSIEKAYNNTMYPYAGLRIEFTLTTRELCQKYI